MPDLPPDGSRVEAMTYASIEYDRDAQKAVGTLHTHPSPWDGPPQCWVDGVQVDPATVHPAGQSHAEAPVVPVRQSTAWTCGPAALATAARLVGLDVTEAQAQALAGADPDEGTPPEQMVDAAGKLGLDAQAVERMTPTQLASVVQAGQPVVVCMVAPSLDSTAVTDMSGHWAVVTGADAGGFTLQDPAEGEVRMPAADLMARWADQDADGRVYSRFGIVVRGRGK